MPTDGEIEETEEDVAKQYLGELIDRFMVQVFKRDHTGNAVKRCRIHDLIRNFCALKAREDSFSGIIQNHESEGTTSSASAQHSGTTHSRRISIHQSFDVDWIKQVQPNLRSFFLFDTSYELPLRIKNFRLLRVLELKFLREDYNRNLSKIKSSQEKLKCREKLAI